MNEKYTINELGEIIKRYYELRKENQEQQEEIRTLKHQKNFIYNEYIEEKTKNCKAREYINQLDELESKIDDYAISKYVRQELLNILESKGE